MVYWTHQCKIMFFFKFIAMVRQILLRVITLSSEMKTQPDYDY